MNQSLSLCFALCILSKCVCPWKRPSLYIYQTTHRASHGERNKRHLIERLKKFWKRLSHWLQLIPNDSDKRQYYKHQPIPLNVLFNIYCELLWKIDFNFFICCFQHMIYKHYSFYNQGITHTLRLHLTSQEIQSK